MPTNEIAKKDEVIVIKMLAIAEGLPSVWYLICDEDYIELDRKLLFTSIQCFVGCSALSSYKRRDEVDHCSTGDTSLCCCHL